MVKWSMPTGRGGKQLFNPKTGRNINRGSRGAPTPPTITSTTERNKIFEDFRAGKISQADAIGLVVGASAKASFQSRVAAEVQVRQQQQRQSISRQREREGLARRIEIARKKQFLDRLKPKSFIVTRQKEEEKRQFLEGIRRKPVPFGMSKKQTQKPKEPGKKGFDVFSIDNIQKRVLASADFLTGGYFTERSLDKKENKISKDIQDFNKKYGGRDLSEAEYNKAKKLSKSIETGEEAVAKARDKLAESTKSKLIGFLYPLEKRKTRKQIADEIKENKPALKTQEKNLVQIKQRIKVAEKKRGSVAKLNLKRLEAVRGGIKQKIRQLKDPTFKPIILMGDLPLVPTMSIPSGVTSIKFLGTQKKGSGGKIITDIVFKTDKGRVGIAKGISITKGKTGHSVTLGRSGRVAIKIPSGKQKIIDIKSFAGLEKTRTVPETLKLSKKLTLLTKGKKMGLVVKTTKNLKVMKQSGIGKVASVGGKKFMYPRLNSLGKISKVKAGGISVDDFASISAILTKKELSLIVGKSITGIGAKSKFVGLIKGTSKAGKVYTVAEKQQFAKGLEKLIGVTASALSKAERTKGITKLVSLAKASQIAVATAKTTAKQVTIRKARTKQVTIVKTKTKKTTVQKTTPRTKTTPKTKTRIKTKTKNRTQTISKSKQQTKQRPLQKTSQKPKQKTKQKNAQRQKQKQRQKTTTKQKQKQVVTKAKAKSPSFPKGIRVIGIPKGRKKNIAKGRKAKPKKKQAYNTFARPRRKKGRKKPKLIKVNKVPLKKNKAKDLRNYISDTSLARTSGIRKTKGKPKTSRLKVPSGYAKKSAHKFRRYKIVKGKRKTLPKGKVIERKKYLLDSRREKKQIGLRKRIRQITKPKRKTVKRTVRKPTRTTRTTPKRTNRPKPQPRKKTRQTSTRKATPKRTTRKKSKRSKSKKKR